MRAHLLLLAGTLWLGVLSSVGCDDGPKGGPDASIPEEAGTDGGPRDDGGPSPDGGTSASDFACDVGRQSGCDAGASCLYTTRPDGGVGSACVAGPCDVVLQDCPSGQRCTYVLANGTRTRQCVEEGTSAEGDPCSLASASGEPRFDTCQRGLSCADTATADGGTRFQCQRFCHGSAQCGAPQECNVALRLSGTRELPLLCGPPSARCGLLAQDCVEPLGCYPSGTPGAAACAASGARPTGAPCEFSNQCERGSVCVGTGAERACAPLCALPSGTPGCASGTTCQPLTGHPDVGACVP